MMDVYMEYGAIGIIVSLFVMMIMNLIKSQKAQNEDLDQIRVDIGRIEGTIENCESIILKMLDCQIIVIFKHMICNAPFF